MRIVLGSSASFRLVALGRRPPGRPSVQRLGGQRSHEEHDETVTRSDDPPEATAAPGATNPGRLCRGCRRTRQVFLVRTRPAEPGADPPLPPPSARRTAPRVAFLSPGSRWPEVLLHHNARLGYAPPQPATSHGAITIPAGPERGGTPAPVHGREASPAPRPPDDHLCRWPPRQRRRPAHTPCDRKCAPAAPRRAGQRPQGSLHPPLRTPADCTAGGLDARSARPGVVDGPRPASADA